MTKPFRANTTPDGFDHDLNAMAHLAGAAVLADRGAKWAADEGQLAHAQVQATLALAEAVLAPTDAIRAGRA